MTTIKEVAARAGVSSATVSHVLNGTRYVSDVVREQVQRAMAELDYQPHLFARGLATRRTHLLALLYPIREAGFDPATSAFIMGAARAAREHGYHLIYWLEEAVDRNALRQLTGQGLVDGVILMEIHRQDERVERLHELKFPFSMIGRREDNLDNYVDTDFNQAMRDAINYLAGLGHTRIAFLNQSQTRYEAGYGPVIRCKAAFEQIIHTLGLTGITRFCEWDSNAGYVATKTILHEQPETTAVITVNEAALSGILRASYERGWKVPDDFSLLALVPSSNLAEFMLPKLTVMEIPTMDLARVATEIVIKQLEGETTEPMRVLLPCRLVIGESTGLKRQSR